jgi:outer membrane protein assembly factor BamA
MTMQITLGAPLALVGLCLTVLTVGPVHAQGSIPQSPTAGLPTSHESKLGFSQGSFFAAPIPSLSPTFGTGLTIVGGYLFKADEESKNSFLGGGAYRTTNGSEGYGLAASIALDSNRWQATIFGGTVEVNYDLFVLGEAIPISQEGDLAQMELLYGFTPELASGLGFRYLNTSITRESGGILPNWADRDAELKIASYGWLFDWDRRNDSFYPTTGSNLGFSLYQNEILDTDRDYQKAVLLFDYYLSPLPRGVIATRLALCQVSDGTPFFDACSLGGTDSFRGFSVTEHLGEQLASFQAAYRGLIGDRFGYAVFAGAGQVNTRFDLSRDDNLNYAGGVGVRYRLTEKFPLDLSADVALNDDREETFYVYVGQRF